MILLARPLSVFVSLSYSSMNWREKSLIAWIGLRGAVPIVLATYPLVQGIDKAEYIFNLVFFVAISSLMIQGTSIKFVAKLLGLYIDEPQKPEASAEHTSHVLSKNMTYVTIPVNSSAIHKSIVDMKLPNDLLIVLIERGEEVIIPRGATLLEANDKLMILAEKESLKLLKEKI